MIRYSKALASVQRESDPRRGAMIVVMLFLLTIVLAMVVFTVDTAYMQLVRTELRAAADAAAKAGAAALGDSLGDPASARAAAIMIASRNKVGGRPLTLADADIEVGNSVRQADGTWEFTPDVTPLTAVRVTANMSSATSAGPVNLLFARMFNHGTFEPLRVATASQMEQDIVLCVDRSHSMTFDDSGIDWQYPTGIPNFPLSLKQPPHPTKSRWAYLQDALDVFVDTVDNNSNPPQVALVTWGSKITYANFEGSYTGQTFPATNLDEPLGFVCGNVKSKIHGRGAKVMLGATNMSAGLDMALTQFSSTNARPLAKKVIVLMTDGQWNQGRDPIEAAEDARDAGVIIHTVTFLDGVDQSEMQAIADLTGGRHYHASSGEELYEVFEALALSLSVSLTD